VRILLVRIGALGDILLLRRAVAALTRAGHRSVLLAPGRTGAILVGPGVAEVEAAVDFEDQRVTRALCEVRDGADATLAGTLPAALEGLDAALVLSRDPDILALVSRMVSKVVVRDPSPPKQGPLHASLWLAEPVRDFGADPLPDPPFVEPSPEEVTAVVPFTAQLPAHFIAIHPGSGSAAKNWPAERFAETARGLARGQPWLLVLGPADASAGSPLAREPEAVVVRSLPVRVLGALLSRASLYLGNDSGVTHLAAAWGAPTLALFGPTDPAVWGPVGPRARSLRAPDGDLSGLDVAAVAVVTAEVQRTSGARPSRLQDPG
jgi:heptosyltransferase-3